LLERRGTAPEVNHGTPYGASNRAYEFALGLLDLVMHATQDVPFGSGVVVLHELRIDAGGLAESTPAVAFKEEAPFIFKRHRLEYEHIPKHGLNNTQG